MIKELIKLATHLDERGLVREADYLDAVVRKIAVESGIPEYMEQVEDDWEYGMGEDGNFDFSPPDRPTGAGTSPYMANPFFKEKGPTEGRPSGEYVANIDRGISIIQSGISKHEDALISWEKEIVPQMRNIKSEIMSTFGEEMAHGEYGDKNPDAEDDAIKLFNDIIHYGAALIREISWANGLLEQIEDGGAKGELLKTLSAETRTPDGIGTRSAMGDWSSLLPSSVAHRTLGHIRELSVSDESGKVIIDNIDDLYKVSVQIFESYFKFLNTPILLITNNLNHLSSNRAGPDDKVRRSTSDFVPSEGDSEFLSELDHNTPHRDKASPQYAFEEGMERR